MIRVEGLMGQMLAQLEGNKLRAMGPMGPLGDEPESTPA
jgi:hypothetical protein